jgi:hypothetical protein
MQLLYSSRVLEFIEAFLGNVHLNNTRTYICLYGLMVRVPGYSTDICCTSCKVRTESIYVM